MKLKLYTLLFLFALAQTSINSQSITNDWQTKATAHVQGLAYSFYQNKASTYWTSNNNNRMKFHVSPAGYSVYSSTDQNNSAALASFHLQHISRSKETSLFGHAKSEQSANRLVYHFSVADAEYINNEAGFRQNFIVRKKLAGNGAMKISIHVKTGLQPQLINGEKLVFTDPSDNKVQLSYEDLRVWDAHQKQLPATMEFDSQSGILSLVVEDKGATYPITVDPLNKSAEWTTSADGILPGLLTSLQLQVHTLYGFTVTGLGDINSDGFDDVAISAPGMADVISGTGVLTDVGAVFIYLGSPSGLPVVPSKILQPTTAVAGALFGFSVAAGDVTGDGIPDIVIGAPMDTYQTTASGLFGSVNVDVTAGKVYVYSSETLFTSANPSPFLQLRLQGSNFFSTGVLGLLNNITVKSLFGFSVAVTEDLNNDNKKDILIGSPSYLGTSLLSVQAGAAFVYYSDNFTTLTPVQLNVPSPSVLGLITLPLANLNGLLFGFSVEGCGDYNNDGNPDIVVGAPAGIDLSSLGGIFSGQVLGGSGYVYYGNGSGVNSSIGARLQASPSGLLSNAANLFGYKIKSVRDAAGNRNGNILISAPVANVVSNIIGGLQIKAGAVHVFKKKTTSFSSPVLSDQAIASPRSSSILSSLMGQSIEASLLFGAGLDNTLDMNCDNIGDIIVGEPLSTTVPLIGANVTGGAAYIYLGKSDGTYNSSPTWSVYPEVSPLLGVNASSLLGFSVAGAGYVKGVSEKKLVLAGGPANALDFGSGLLDIGNTVGVLFNFAFDNNGLGKSYGFTTNLCGLTTLPVTLTSFNGQAVNDIAQLKWQSVNEHDLAFYELQRSNNGNDFHTLSMVFAKNVNSNEYVYPDKHPAKGTNYYRLKMVDNDGTFTYSAIVIIHFGDLFRAAMNISPNPVQKDFNVQLEKIEPGSYSLNLLNAFGQPIQQKQVNITTGRQIISMSLQSDLPGGIYYLNLVDKTGKRINGLKLIH